MKHFYMIFLATLLMTIKIFAQSPEKMSYQAIVRDASNNLKTNQTVGMQISILQGSVNGTAVYVEIQTPTTNINGLVTIEIGEGTVVSGNFSSIDWSNGPYFIKTETDPTGGTGYTITGTSQLLSVPYALYAKTAGNGFSGSFADLTNKPTTLASYGIIDAMSTNHVANGITSTNINNWDAAYAWGNHATAGYLKSYTESDPVYAKDSIFIKTSVNEWNTSAAKNITSSNINNWDAAYAWGNHAAAGYLKSYTETDPVYAKDSLFIKTSVNEWNTSAAKNITSSNINNWDATYGWGNHATAGYLKSYTETDPVYAKDSLLLKTNIAINKQAVIDTAAQLRADMLKGDSAYLADSSFIKTNIAINKQAVIDTAAQLRADMLKGDSAYLADSSFIKTNIAINKQAVIDTAVQLRADMLKGGSAYLADSSFIKSSVRNWNSSLAKNITTTDTAYWNHKSDFDGNYSSLTNAPDIAVSTTDKNITLASGQTFSVKDASNTYLRINQSSGLVGINKVTSPLASLEVGGYDGLLCTGAANYGTARALGPGVRFQWYPRRGALRAGMAESTWWDDDGSTASKMGLYSCAIGYQPRATGAASNAIGAYNKAIGDYSLALGSYCQASGNYDIAIGTQVYASGIYSTAIGNGADTNGKDGAMVIGDDSYFQTAYASTDNELTMRFSGGYRLWSSYPDSTSGVYMRHRQSGWSNYCDRNKKENFKKLNYEEVLKKIDKQIPITAWNYKKTDTACRYIGPMAQDFYAAFQLGGTDSLGINSINEMGINMAAIHGLIDRTNSLKQNIDSLQTENSVLKQQLETMQQRLDALETLVGKMAKTKQIKNTN